MSIATNLQKLETDITNAYNTINTKGGTIPSDKNTNNLSTAISSIPSGGATLQSKSITITQNGNTSVTPDTGYDGLSNVSITTNVSGSDEILKKVIDNSVVSLNIPSGTQSVEAFKFYSCTTLTNLTLPDSLQTIGASAFRDCTNLTNFNFPNSLQTIGSTAFQDCTNLTNLALPNSIRIIESSTFRDCTNLTNFNFPNNLQTIGASAFYGCAKLEEAIIPNTVTNIGTSAFYGCKKLAIVNIPTSYNIIPQYCFYQCESLTRIVIPNSITIIAVNSFYGCTGIIEYNFSALDHIPQLVNKNAFTNINANCKMVVPDDLYDSWIAATNWSSYANYIIKESDYNAS